MLLRRLPELSRICFLLPPRVLLDPRSSSLTHALPFRCRVLRQVAAETVDPRFLEVLPPHRPLASILSDASIAATSLCTPVSGGRPSVAAVLVIHRGSHLMPHLKISQAQKQVTERGPWLVTGCVLGGAGL